MEAQDFTLTDDGDLFINDKGDLDIGFSDKQHIKDIINANIGWYKQFPLIGVGVDYYLNSAGKEQQLEKEIKIQLRSDGYSVDRATITKDNNGNITINPNAIRE